MRRLLEREPIIEQRKTLSGFTSMTASCNFLFPAVAHAWAVAPPSSSEERRAGFGHILTARKPFRPELFKTDQGFEQSRKEKKNKKNKKTKKLQDTDVHADTSNSAS